MKRPLKSRIWFRKPDWDWDLYWFKRWAWKPFSFGDDEFGWHTWTFGFPWTGSVVIAIRPCPVEGCFTEEDLIGLALGGFNPTPEWPIDTYGWDHSKSDLENAWEHPDLYPNIKEIYEDYPEEWDKYHAERCSRGSFCSAHQPGAKID